jgi:hypothetical protein
MSARKSNTKATRTFQSRNFVRSIHTTSCLLVRCLTFAANRIQAFELPITAVCLALLERPPNDLRRNEPVCIQPYTQAYTHTHTHTHTPVVFHECVTYKSNILMSPMGHVATGVACCPSLVNLCEPNDGKFSYPGAHKFDSS